MPNTILKRWNGSSFEELYPKTTVGQISATGTPSASTYLRGDGQWVTPGGGERKFYNSISGTSGAWYDLFTVSDGATGALFVSIQTYAHDDLLFTVGTGYSTSAVNTITILNCVYNPSGPYASITGVRVTDSGLVQAQFTWSSGPTVDIDVAVYGSGTLPTLSASLTANATSYTIDDTVSITGLQGKIRSENGFVQGTTAIPAGTGTANQITYWSGTNAVSALSTATYPSLTELSYVKGVTSALQTQLNNKPNEITKYKATATNNATTTPAAITTVTLLANKYYQIDVVGQWSKASTSGSTSPRITVAVDNTTGTPTMNGQFFWLNSGTTAYTVGILSGAITTTTTTMGFTTATAQLNAITVHPWNMRSLFYAGTSDKVLTFYVYQSAAVSGNVTCDNISITAVEVAS